MGNAAVPGADLRREVLASCVINAVMSTAMFLLVFGAAGQPLATGAPDDFAFDFVPQSLVLSFLSAALPALALRARRLRAASGAAAMGAAAAGIPTVGALLRRALLLAAGGAVAGLLATGAVMLGGWTAFAWPLALALKLGWGVALGAVVTVLALRPLLR